MSAEVEAYSDATGKGYNSFDDLIYAEANGWVVVAILRKGVNTWPWVVGPFTDKPDAQRARNRLRTKLKREQQEQGHEQVAFNLFVRPSWKDDR
jgi:hypothetical protein